MDYVHEYSLSPPTQRAWFQWFLQQHSCEEADIAEQVNRIEIAQQGVAVNLPERFRYHPEMPPNGFLPIPPLNNDPLPPGLALNCYSAVSFAD